MSSIPMQNIKFVKFLIFFIFVTTNSKRYRLLLLFFELLNFLIFFKNSILLPNPDLLLFRCCLSNISTTTALENIKLLIASGINDLP